MQKITLKSARVNKNLTQQEAANLIQVSLSTLKSWERGKSFPTPPKIERICDVYGVSYDQIFFGY